MVKIQDLAAAEMTANAEKLVSAILKGDPGKVGDVLKDFKDKGRSLETIIKTKLSINDLRDIQNLSESSTALVSWIALSGLKIMTPFHIAALVDGRNIVEVFLKETDISVDYSTPENITILHLASFAGYFTLVETLVNIYKADVTLQDDWGRLAIHYAASGGHLAVVKYLISKGADPIVRDKAGRTAIMYAWDKQKYDVVEHLQDYNRSGLGGRVPMHPQGDFSKLPFETSVDPVVPPKEVFRSNPIYHENIETVETNMKVMNVKDNTTKESGSTSDDSSGPASKMLFFERPPVQKDEKKNREDTQTPPWKYYDLPPRKVFTKAELAKMKSKAEKRRKKEQSKKHKIYDELDNFPDYSDQVYAQDNPQYSHPGVYTQPMQQYYDPYDYFYDNQAYPLYAQTPQENTLQSPPLFSYQENGYPEFQREIIYSDPHQPAQETVRMIQEPQMIIQDPPEIIGEPQRIIREPPRVIHESPIVMHEPPRVIHEPPRVIHEPPRVIREPPRVIREPPRVIHEQTRVIHEQPHIRHVPSNIPHNPGIIEGRPASEIIRRPMTITLPDGRVVRQYPIEPPRDGRPTRIVRRIPPPREGEVYLRQTERELTSLYGPPPYPTSQELYPKPSSNYSKRRPTPKDSRIY